MVGQSTLAAGLERAGIAPSRRVEVVDRDQDRVGVLAGAVLSAVDCSLSAGTVGFRMWLQPTVGDDVATVRLPEALLEAEDMGGRGQAGAAFSAQLGSKRSSLHQGCAVLVLSSPGHGKEILTPMGAGNGKERAAGNLLPQIKAGLVPANVSTYEAGIHRTDVQGLTNTEQCRQDRS